jgi:thiol-disulfide isomerase/thioredoxin
MKHTFKLAMIVMMSAVQASAAERDSVVNTGGCSGVVVRGNLILTAEHCGHSTGLATASGRSASFDVAYDPARNNVDECVVLRLSGSPFPSVLVANVPAKVGDKVYTYGYPSGKLTRVSGKVSRVDSMVHCDFSIWEGHSGGPLFNASGEVIGLASARNLRHQKPGSHWIPLSSIHTSLAKVAPKPVVYLFTWNKCVPCQRLKPHYSEMRRSLDLRVVEYGTSEYIEAAKAYAATTGQTIEAVPTLWVEGTKSAEVATKFTVGPAFNVLSIVAWVVRQAAGLIVGRIRERGDEAETQPITPVPESAPLPTPISAPDYSSVTIVLLLAKEDVGFIRGKVREKAIGAVSGPLRRRIDNMIGKSASMAIVSQRLSPGRFEAVTGAAKTSINRFGIIVLIAKRDLGIVKGIGLKVAERIATGKLANAPVDVIFQRSHPAAYSAVSTALGVSEPVASTPAIPIPALKSLSLTDIKGVVADALASQASHNKHFPSNPPVVEDEDGSTIDQQSVNTGMLGMLLLGAMGFAASHLKKKLSPSRKKK